jgi:hypothetical protein
MVTNRKGTKMNTTTELNMSVANWQPFCRWKSHVADCSNPDRAAVIRWKRVSQANVDLFQA